MWWVLLATVVTGSVVLLVAVSCDNGRYWQSL